MNLVRLGHYFTPSVTSGDLEAGLDLAGSCRTALVVHVWNRDEPNEMVNLAMWNQNGGQETRSSVNVEVPGVGHDSFHLSGECPWRR